MDTRELIEILSADIEDVENVDRLFIATLTYIEENEKNDFKTRKPRFVTLVEKLIEIIKYHYPEKYTEGLKSQLLDTATSLSESVMELSAQGRNIISNLPNGGMFSILSDIVLKTANTNEERLIFRCSTIAAELEKIILSTFTEIKSQKLRQFSFYNLYIPESANKLDAEKLIKESIEIIQNDNFLSPEAKRIIVEHLEKALKSLRTGKTSEFFGNIKEVIIVLGALGSFVGGYVAAAEQVKVKLEEASHIIEETSTDKNCLLPNYPPYINITPQIEGKSNDIPLLPEEQIKNIEQDSSEQQK